MNLSSDEEFIKKSCQNEEIYSTFEEYVNNCLCLAAEDNAEDKKKSKGSKKQAFPNLAGFCRYLKISVDDFEKLLGEYPSLFKRILTALEDEALNADISPSLLTAYLKKRLKYDSTSQQTEPDATQMQIFFEHDIFEDGG